MVLHEHDGKATLNAAQRLYTLLGMEAYRNLGETMIVLHNIQRRQKDEASCTSEDHATKSQSHKHCTQPSHQT